MLYAVYVLLFVLYSGWFGQHIVSFYRTYGFRLLLWYIDIVLLIFGLLRKILKDHCSYISFFPNQNYFIKYFIVFIQLNNLKKELRLFGEKFGFPYIFEIKKVINKLVECWFRCSSSSVLYYSAVWYSICTLSDADCICVQYTSYRLTTVDLMYKISQVN